MSPDPAAAIANLVSFPRVSGDEPEPIMARTNLCPFSPRERG